MNEISETMVWVSRLKPRIFHGLNIKDQYWNWDSIGNASCHDYNGRESKIFIVIDVKTDTLRHHDSETETIKHFDFK